LTRSTLPNYRIWNIGVNGLRVCNRVTV